MRNLTHGTIMPDMSSAVVVIDEVAKAAKVDRYGELQRKVIAFRPTLSEYESLGKEIQAWFANDPADKPLLAEGARYQLQLSARELQRAITDMKKVRRLMGAEKFIELCSMALKHVDALIDASKHDLFLRAERTGHRKIVAVLKAEQAA